MSHAATSIGQECLISIKLGQQQDALQLSTR